MPRAAFCVSSKKEGGTHHSKRDQKSLHRHRNADRQRNRPAGAALPPRLSSQARGALPYYRGDGQPADQGPAYLVPVFPEYRRGCHHLSPAVLRKILGKARDAPVPQPKPVSQKQALSLPPRNADDRRVFAYLRKRGIAVQAIRQFLNAGLLYEDAVHHNCVFGRRDGIRDRRKVWRDCAAPMIWALDPES